MPRQCDDTRFDRSTVTAATLLLVTIDKFSNPLVRDGVERLVTENNGYAIQRLATIENSTLARFASQGASERVEVFAERTALNAESVTAYARALQATQYKVNELAQRVSAGRFGPHAARLAGGSG